MLDFVMTMTTFKPGGPLRFIFIGISLGYYKIINDGNRSIKVNAK